MELLLTIASIATLVLLAVPRFDAEREDTRRELAQRQRQALVKTATRRRRSAWSMATAAVFAGVGGLLAGLWRARLPLAAIIAPAMLGFALLSPGQLPGAFVVSGVAAVGVVLIPLLSVRALEGRSHHRELLGVIESIRAVWVSTPAWARIGVAAMVLFTAASPALSLVLPRVASVISLGVGAVLYVVVIVLSLAGLRALIARRLAECARIEEARRGVAAALRLPDAAAAELVVHVEGDRLAVELPVRAGVLEGDLESRLVGAGLTAWAYDLQSQAGDGRHVLWMRPVDEETLARRALQAASGGLAVDAQQQDDGRVRIELVAGISPARANDFAGFVAREYEGYSLVEWRPHERYAIIERLSDLASTVRSRIAQLTKSEPWSVRVTVEEREGRLDSVVIEGAAPVARTPQERIDSWRQLVLSLPGGSNGWAVSEEPVSGTVTLTYGAPRKLPDIVKLEDILPAELSPDDWARLPLGLGETGQPVGLDLRLGPHTVLAGPTGSGKTVGILTLATQQLVRGFDLAIIDPSKEGVDFKALEPYARGFARTYAESAALIRGVYEEGRRRIAVLHQHGAVKWSDLPVEVRAAEGIRPVALIIDELASLLIEQTIPKGLPKDAPEVIEGTELNAHKAILSLYVGKIARELRFVGVHLLLALQRPDAAILGGETRSNITSTIQQAKPGSPPNLDAIRMLFPGDAAQEAYDTLRALDDGHSLGLGAVAGDGGGVAGVRVAYAPMAAIPGLLAERGVYPTTESPFAASVPERTPVDSGPVTGRRIIEPPADEPVVDLGEVSLDLGDLDGEFAAIPAPVATAQSAQPADLLDDLFN